MIDALLECLGSEGTLVMPAMTFGRWAFHPERAPSEVGRVTEVFRQRPGVRRSLHPTHSVCAFGPLAPTLLAGHEHTTAFGRNSPLGRIVELGGWVLLLGVGQTRNSTIHVGEEWWEAPFYGHRDEVSVLDEEGRRHLVLLEHQPGCSQGFDSVEPVLRARGSLLEDKVGNCLMKLAKSREIIDAVKLLLDTDIEALFCKNSYCSSCAEKRAKLQEWRKAQ